MSSVLEVESVALSDSAVASLVVDAVPVESAQEAAARLSRIPSKPM